MKRRLVLAYSIFPAARLLIPPIYDWLLGTCIQLVMHCRRLAAKAVVRQTMCLDGKIQRST